VIGTEEEPFAGEEIMGLGFDEISRELAERWECRCYESSPARISHVATVKEDFSSPKEGVLYVSTWSSIEKLERHPGMNFVVVTDEAIEFSPIAQDCNLILLVSPEGVGKVVDLIQDILIEQSRIMDNDMAILEAALDGDGIQGILAEAFRSLGNPIMVTDRCFNVMDHTKGMKVENVEWKSNINMGRSSDALVRSWINDKVFDRHLEERSPILISSGLEKKEKWLAGRIEVGGQTAGYVGVLEYEREFRKSDYHTVELLCRLLSGAAGNKSNEGGYLGFVNDEVLTDLLAGREDTISPVVLSDRLRRINMGQIESFQVLVLDVDPFDSTRMLVPYLIDNIGRLVEKVSAVEFENNLVLIIAIKRYSYIRKHDIGFLEKYLTERNMHGGLSRSFEEIREIRKYYRQAISAMKSGFRLHPSKSLYHYDDYAAYAMMEECCPKRDLLEFCHPAVISLYEKDRQEGTDDLKSLIEYAVCFRNINKAAQALGIHRNTLSYRIARIVDETRIDLNNWLTVSELMQSMRILEYMNMN
jgi:hypothetical protein